MQHNPRTRNARDTTTPAGLTGGERERERRMATTAGNVSVTICIFFCSLKVVNLVNVLVLLNYVLTSSISLADKMKKQCCLQLIKLFNIDRKFREVVVFELARGCGCG